MFTTVERVCRRNPVVKLYIKVLSSCTFCSALLTSRRCSRFLAMCPLERLGGKKFQAQEIPVLIQRRVLLTPGNDGNQWFFYIDVA